EERRWNHQQQPEQIWIFKAHFRFVTSSLNQGQSGGKPAALQTLRVFRGCQAVASAFGVRWLQPRFQRTVRGSYIVNRKFHGSLRNTVCPSATSTSSSASPNDTSHGNSSSNWVNLLMIASVFSSLSISA